MAQAANSEIHGCNLRFFCASPVEEKGHFMDVRLFVYTDVHQTERMALEDHFLSVGERRI